MNKIQTLWLCCLLASTSLSAQTTYTSPAGLASTEGNGSFLVSTDRRYQCIDASHMDEALILRSIAWRRDQRYASRGGASTVDLSLNMGEVNMVAVSSRMDFNYSASSRTQVHPLRTVNWPDWSQVVPSPAPFDMQVPFAAPFSYSGNLALVWDLNTQRGSNPWNFFDQDITPPVTGRQIALGNGKGCDDFALQLEMQSNGEAMQQYGMRMVMAATGAPPAAPVSLGLALQSFRVTLPGICGDLFLVPDLILPLGISDNAGQTPTTSLNLAYDKQYEGTPLVGQAFAPHNGALELSTGWQVTMPASTEKQGHEACFLWCPLATSPQEGKVFFGGGIIAQLGT